MNALVDRLSGASVAEPAEPFLIGRYSDLWRAPSPLVGTPREGDPQLPDDAIVNHVLRMRGALHGDRRVHGWLERPTLILGEDVQNALATSPLEQEINRRLGHLAAVCREPRSKLRSEHVLLPVSKVRRISARTITHLARHSEVWAGRTRDGVQPNALYGPVNVSDVNLVENRIVAELLDGLSAFMGQRVGQLRRINTMIHDVHRYLDDARLRVHRTAFAAYEQISSLLEGTSVGDAAAAALEEAERLDRGLKTLAHSPLRKGIMRPYNPGRSVPATNLFVNDAHYAQCGALWKSLVGERSQSVNAAERVHRAAEWCSGFDSFVALHVVHALQRLRLTPAETAPAPQESATCFTGPFVGQVTLEWTADNVFVLHTGEGRRTRIVPLPHRLTATMDLTEVNDALRAIAASVEGSPDPVVVVYPGERGERRRLPPALRAAAHHYSLPKAGSLAALVPVSPYEIDSVDRVARALRWYVDARLHRELGTITVDEPVAHALASRLDWLRPARGGLEAKNPPPPITQADLQRNVAAIVKSAPGSRPGPALDHRSERTAAAVAEAASTLLGLASCPVCPYEPDRPQYSVVVREDHTYHAHCDQCGSTWETRKCKKCGELYPVITTPEAAQSLGGPEDEVEQVLTHEVLATQCWSRERTYVCARCQFCANSSDTTDCARCHTST